MAKQQYAALDSRFARSVIAGQQYKFNAIELHGVRDISPKDAPQGSICEVDDEDPDFYSVYLHLVPNESEGGLECVGNFGSLTRAQQYASELATQHGWPVHCSVYDPEVTL
jgi:hypothetical protein